MWNLKNNINEPANRNRLIDAENWLLVVRGEGAGGWVRKVKGLPTKYRLVVTKQSREGKSSTGNTVSNTVITVYCARSLEFLGAGENHFINCMNV